MRVNTRDIKALENFAEENLSHYDGGLDTMLFDFSGAQALGGSVTKTATVTIINTGVSTQKVVLFAGLQEESGSRLKTNGLVTVGEEFNGIGGAGTLSATCSTSLKDLRYFLNRNPHRLISMQLSTDNEINFAQNFEVRQIDPIEPKEAVRFPISSFRRETNFNGKLLNISMNTNVDDQTEIALTVVGNSSLTLVLEFGLSINQGKALQKTAAAVRQAVATQAADPGVLQATKLSSQPVKQIGV